MDHTTNEFRINGDFFPQELLLKIASFLGRSIFNLGLVSKQFRGITDLFWQQERKNNSQIIRLDLSQISYKVQYYCELRFTIYCSMIDDEQITDDKIKAISYKILAMPDALANLISQDLAYRKNRLPYQSFHSPTLVKILCNACYTNPANLHNLVEIFHQRLPLQLKNMIPI